LRQGGRPAATAGREASASHFLSDLRASLPVVHFPGLADESLLNAKLGNRYEISGELGRGGMGVVYRARDPLLNREVAVKLISGTDLTPELEERFQREAQIVAQMDHPAIVPIYDFGRHDGSLFFVMPVVSGTNLLRLIREQSLRLGEVIDIGIQVADALDYSHSRNVIHRDIKPANIFLVGSRAVLSDFGLALPVDPSASAPTEPPGPGGTPGYMAPEHGLSGTVTPLSDLYVVAMVLYEALTGRHWEVPGPGAAGNWTGVPRPLRHVLRRALAWSPERRWRDAAAFRRAPVPTSCARRR
jgi:serine/threonine protein kinase